MKVATVGGALGGAPHRIGVLPTLSSSGTPDDASTLPHVDAERYERGLDAYASQFGIDRDEVPAWFEQRFGSRFGEEAIRAAAGAWVDDCLSLRDRSLIVVAALIAQGGLEARLRGHVRWAIEHGSSGEELEALATLLAVYVGYPRASAGMEIVRDELARLEQG